MAKDPKDIKILVAEDEEILCKAIEYRLSLDGYIIIMAKDGREAAQLVSEKKPDLVITDLMMPFKTGLEILEQCLNQSPPIPVIVLSGLDQEKNVNEALEMGAEDYITKPFSPNELSIRVKKQILRLNN